MANYINNKAFEELIQQYMAGDRSIQDELFEYFDILITHLMNGYSFKIDKEEAKQECFLLILRVLNNFNKENGKAFNYFTTVILNNLRLIYTKNKKYNQKILNYTNHVLGNYGVSSTDLEP